MLKQQGNNLGELIQSAVMPFVITTSSTITIMPAEIWRRETEMWSITMSTFKCQCLMITWTLWSHNHGGYPQELVGCHFRGDRHHQPCNRITQGEEVSDHWPGVHGSRSRVSQKADNSDRTDKTDYIVSSTMCWMFGSHVEQTIYDRQNRRICLMQLALDPDRFCAKHLHKRAWRWCLMMMIWILLTMMICWRTLFLLRTTADPMTKNLNSDLLGTSDMGKTHWKYPCTKPAPKRAHGWISIPKGKVPIPF